MYGICELSVIPVRTEPSDKSELCTQLLFGELYLIVEENDKWCKIKSAIDGYEGWIDKIQHVAVDKDYFNGYLEMTHPVLNTFSSLVTVGSNFIPILLGSTLPFYDNGKVWLGNKQVSVDYEAKSSRSLIDTAFLFYNAPYLWGGKTPYGIDCSGFTQQVFKLLGKRIPRDAYQQAEDGEVVSLENAQSGDLAFFENKEQRITHVGIVLPKHQIIHAHGKVRIDKLDKEGIWNNERDCYSHNLSLIKRMS